MPRKPVNANALRVFMEPPESGKRAPWPPKDTLRSLDVSRDGWDWGSAAVSYGVLDPLDLVHFNFLTTDPEQVNWYLRNYVGCINSDDGRYFTFRGADPGVIFIPQLGYTRKSPGTTAVEKRALNELWTNVWPHYPDFWYKGVHYSRQNLELLIAKIENNKVDVIWDTVDYTQDTGKLHKNAAGRWHFKDSAIYLRSANFFDMDALGTLVHEATHALTDIMAKRHPEDYKMVDDEIAANFAEAYWLIEYYEYYGAGSGREVVEYEIGEATGINISISALYLAFIARTQGHGMRLVRSFSKPYENILEKGKRKKVFPDPFNPYQTLRDAIATDPLYEEIAMKRKKWHTKPVGK